MQKNDWLCDHVPVSIPVSLDRALFSSQQHCSVKLVIIVKFDSYLVGWWPQLLDLGFGFGLNNVLLLHLSI